MINQAEQTLHIHTNGSGIKGNIGGAAYSPKDQTTRIQSPGGDALFNVYAAELKAIHISMARIWKYITQNNKCVIFTDNQAAIKATESPAQQSGQSIIKDILDAILTLKLDYHIHTTNTRPYGYRGK